LQKIKIKKGYAETYPCHPALPGCRLSLNRAMVTANPHSSLRAPMPTTTLGIAMMHDHAAAASVIILPKVANAQHANPPRMAVPAPFIALTPKPAVMVLRAC
jgi:hypothetical protein